MNAPTRLDAAREMDIRAVASAMGVTLAKNGKQAYCVHSRGPGKGTPSISFYRGRDGRVRFACHSCGAGGDSIDLVELFHGCDRSDALTYLSGELPKVEQTWEPLDEEVVIPYAERVKACEAFYGGCAELDVTAVRWLEDERGIDSLTAERFGLRVVTKDSRTGGQSGERAYAAAIKATSGETALALGIARVPKAGGAMYPELFGHWLVIPYRDLDGRIGHLQFRRLHRGEGKPSGPKYRHIKGVVPLPFNLAAVNTDAPAVGLVEGALDAMRVERLGLPCVGIPGTSWLTPERARRVVERAGDRMLWVGFDADHPRKRNPNDEHSPLYSPGAEAQEKVARWLAQAGADVQTVTWPADFIADETRNDWCDWLKDNDDGPGTDPYVLPAGPTEHSPELADPAAESALVAAVLASPDLLDGWRLDARAFTVEPLGRAWGAASAMWQTEGHVDRITLRARLGVHAVALDSLPAPGVRPALHYARVKGLCEARDALELLARAKGQILQGQPARPVLANVELPEESDSPERQTADQAVDVFWADYWSGRVPYIETGVGAIDRTCRGLPLGKATGVLGLPGSGKTALAFSVISVNIARRGTGVARFSMDTMSEAELIQRDLARAAHVPLDRIQSKTMTDHEMQAMAAASEDYRRLPIFTQHKKDQTSRDVWQDVRHYHRKGVRAFFFDHFHVVHAAGVRDDDENARYGVVGEDACAMAGEFPDSAFVWLGHSNKGFAHRADKAPTVGDWKYGGKFFGGCRLGFGVYRDEMFNPESTMKGYAQICFFKATGSGAVGQRPTMVFDGPRMDFRDLQ